MRAPDSVTRHFRSGLIIADTGASPVSAEVRMTYATARVAKARKYLVNGDYEGADTFCESAVVIAFEAWLMHHRLKFSTSFNSHQATADIAAWLMERSGHKIDTWAMHDLVSGRQAIMYRPWSVSTNTDDTSMAVALAADVVALLSTLPPIKD